MEKKSFSLEMNESNSLTKVFKFILGVLCIAIAIYWIIFNLKMSAIDWSSWVSSAFLGLFGLFMIWTSFGYGYNFIEFERDIIRLKNNSFLPVKEIKSTEIEKIIIYPLKFIIRLKSAKSILTRLGISDIERNENIKDELMKYAESNKILLEIKNEM